MINLYFVPCVVCTLLLQTTQGFSVNVKTHHFLYCRRATDSYQTVFTDWITAVNVRFTKQYEGVSCKIKMTVSLF